MWEFLLFLIPVIPFLWAKKVYSSKINWIEVIAFTAITVVGALSALYLGKYTNTSDVNILNGEVKNKVRHHDSYEESYQCNCRSVSYSCGNSTCSRTECDTCWRTRYTVDWYLNTTIGRIALDHEDSLSSFVYTLPDPNVYKDARAGEHCAKATSYVNYVKAVPDSLFSFMKHDTALKKYRSKVAQYKEHTYSIYKYDHIFFEGVPQADVDAWKEAIKNYLKIAGPQKEVNVQIIVTKERDPNYKYAVEAIWNGGKKNDVVIVVGSYNWPKIDWVDSFTFANSKRNESFVAQMNSALRELNDFKVETAMPVITAHISTNFKRISMQEFEYLFDNITPPLWVILLIVILELVMTALLVYYSINNQFNAATSWRSLLPTRGIMSRRRF